MTWLQWLDPVVKVLAVLIGGFWVLFNYFRGRTHKPRLRLSVVGERAFLGSVEYLIIKAELSNVGLTRVKVSEGCHVTVYAYQPVPEIVMQPEFEKLGIYDLYQDQSFVEPNGLLVDQQLVAVGGFADRFLRVWAHFESAKVGLNAFAVVGPRSRELAARREQPERE